MGNIQVLQQILSERWLIDRSYEQQVAPLILKTLLEGKALESVNAGANVRLQQTAGLTAGQPATYGWRLQVIEGGKVRSIESFSEAEKGAIALLAVDGPIMRSDGWCSMGTETMGKIIKGADQSEQISAIILEVNSPGGQVLGTEQLAGVIDSIAKPIYTYGHFAASAAYWISAATDEIWSSGRSNEFGSIGTMVSWKDYSGYFEQLGIKEIEIYATDSKDKNLPFREAKKGNYKPMQEEILNPTNAIFKSEMKRLRALPEEVLTGSLYIAETALEKGLIDRIGTREALVSHITKKHIQASQHSFSINLNTMAENTDQNGSWLSKLGQMFPNKQTFESLNTELQQTATERDDYKGKYETMLNQLNALKGEKVDLEAQIQTLTQERDDWKSKAEAYGAKPAEERTIAKKEGTDTPATPQEEDWFNPAASHNQFAKEYGQL